jgi:hypothetical protein
MSNTQDEHGVQPGKVLWAEDIRVVTVIIVEATDGSSVLVSVCFCHFLEPWHLAVPLFPLILRLFVRFVVKISSAA